MKKLICLLVLVILVSGCATPFAKYYHDNLRGVDIAQMPSLIIDSGAPSLEMGSVPEDDNQRMFENGYASVGYSHFNAGEMGTKGAITQAKKVKASVVLFYRNYTNTVSGTIPLTLPDNKTITTYGSGSGNHSGNVYGYSGSAMYSGRSTYSGSSTSTIYGTKTTYIPYSRNRYDYLATYWVKQKPLTLGVSCDNLSPVIKKEIGSNKGVIILAVVRDAPAYHADILQGDVIKKINDIEITDTLKFLELLAKYKGEKVTFAIIRDGQEMIKEVKLNLPEH